MPAIVGIPDLMRIARTGDIIIIDGTYGKVILCPTQENVDLYRKYRSDFLRWKRSLKRLRRQPSVTSDQVFIRLKGNIDLPHEVDFLLQTGVDGIGLMRSEYMFLNRRDLPSEDEQFEILRQIVSRMEGKPITFRTFDVGGDKSPDALHPPKTENPALGLRGIRFALKMPTLLKTQFRAVLRACCFGDIRILLPMVTSAEEITSAKNCWRNVPKNCVKIRSPARLPAAAGRNDRNAGRRTGSRSSGRELRLFINRNERPDSIYSGR